MEETNYRIQNRIQGELHFLDGQTLCAMLALNKHVWKTWVNIYLNSHHPILQHFQILPLWGLTSFVCNVLSYFGLYGLGRRNLRAKFCWLYLFSALVYSLSGFKRWILYPLSFQNLKIIQRFELNLVKHLEELSSVFRGHLHIHEYPSKKVEGSYTHS
jgi:hypothetical protein